MYARIHADLSKDRSARAVPQFEDLQRLPFTMKDDVRSAQDKALKKGIYRLTFKTGDWFCGAQDPVVIPRSAGHFPGRRHRAALPHPAAAEPLRLLDVPRQLKSSNKATPGGAVDGYPDLLAIARLKVNVTSLQITLYRFRPL